MFDTVVKTGGVSHEITFNSVAGTLVKSSTESKFIRFHMDSRLAEMFFDENKPYRGHNSRHKRLNVVVLQVMLCGNDNFLVEYIDIEEKDD